MERERKLEKRTKIVTGMENGTGTANGTGTVGKETGTERNRERCGNKRITVIY